MDLRPFNVRNHRVKHAYLASASIGSISVTTPGTGLSFIPVYFWAITSGVASIAVLNGTGGTTFFSIKTAAGVPVEGRYWEDAYLVNKPLVLESTLAGGGITDFHVWYVIRRIGAGSGGTDA